MAEGTTRASVVPTARMAACGNDHQGRGMPDGRADQAKATWHARAKRQAQGRTEARLLQGHGCPLPLPLHTAAALRRPPPRAAAVPLPAPAAG